jgi:ATP-binding cassette subfamily B (MDR/TAP) protein 1
LKFARPEYIFIFPGLLATLLRGCTWPIFSIIYGRLFKLLSAIIATKSGEVPIQNFIEFFLLGAGSGVVTFFSGYMLGISGEKLTRRMRRQLFEVSRKNFV